MSDKERTEKLINLYGKIPICHVCGKQATKGFVLNQQTLEITCNSCYGPDIKNVPEYIHIDERVIK